MDVAITKITIQGFKSFNKKISVPFLPGFNCVTGPNGSGKSSRWDTEILLTNGSIEPIGKLVEDRLKSAENVHRLDDGFITFENPGQLEVLGLNPYSMKIERKKVLAFIKRRGYDHLYEMKTATGKEVVTTGDHPLIAFRDGSVIAERAENLKEGDLIAAPKAIDLDFSLENEDAMELSNAVNPTFAKFLGYIIGEGYVTENSCKFSNNDRMLVNDYLKTCKKLGLKTHTYRYSYKNVTEVVFTSNHFMGLLHKVFRQEKIRSGNKTIPQVFLFASKEVIACLLASLFDGDGSVRKDIPTIEYATKSRTLARQVQFLLLRFGIVSYIKERFQRATNSSQAKEKYHYLYIYGRENLLKFKEQIKILSVDKRKRIESHVQKNAKAQRNKEDLLPKEVNMIIKSLAKLLGIKIKKIRKTYPSLSSYAEDRCFPTREGVANILNLFRNQYGMLDNLSSRLKIDRNILLDDLDALDISRRQASKSIGLGIDTISNSWTYGKFNPKQQNLEKLHRFVKTELEKRLVSSKQLIETLEKLASSDIFWERIKSIEKVKGEEWVYDLSIPECHNFIGNMIFVHNSNILDAIAFVLGRTSAKSMRADRLNELIFHGSDNRKAADYTAVTLYFDNSRKAFPTEGTEVSITRKVNKAGVSAFKLNGKNVNKERVIEFLSAARIHPEGHNIVLQGDVTQIIETSPLERREIIDEISGISEYSEKKDKAMKDLEAVDAKLKEAEIIINERYDIFKRLESESAAAVKYQNLQKRLQLLKASFAKKKFDMSEANHQKILDNASRIEKEMEDLNKEVESTERGVLESETELRKIANRVMDISKSMERDKEASELRAKLMVKKDRLSYSQREMERLDDVIGRLQFIESKRSELAGSLPNAVRAILDAKISGVHGAVINLIKVDEEYQTAIEVAAAHHLYDIVVENDEIAKSCIEYLKRDRIGRATFIPLNKIRSSKIEDDRLLKAKGVVGIAADLVDFDRRFSPAVEFVFGNTLVVDVLDTAQSIGIGKARMVTLDGSLVERSGAMVGGHISRHHEKTQKPDDNINDYIAFKEKLRNETGQLAKEVEGLENSMRSYSQSTEEKGLTEMEKTRIDMESKLDSLVERRRVLYEKKLSMQNELNRMNIQKARVDAELESSKIEVQQYGQIEYVDEKISVLENHIRKTFEELNAIGAVNFKAVEEFEKFRTEFDTYKVKYEKILEEKNAVLKMVDEIDQKRKEVFYKCMNELSFHFNEVFNKMGGGDASLSLENSEDLESGLMIEASPRGKKLLNIDSLSGGEKSLVALAFVFAIQKYKSAPFYIFDEIDAALDKENTDTVAKFIKEFSRDAQFIVITHNDATLKYADSLFGVTMLDGESKVVSLKMPEK